MEKDLPGQRSSYFSGGGCMMSPSCFPVHDEFQYSRLHNYSNNKRGRRWRNILRKFMRESRAFYGSKPTSFQYDPVSYSQNFDDGSHLDEPRRLSHVFHDVSTRAVGFSVQSMNKLVTKSHRIRLTTCGG